MHQVKEAVSKVRIKTSMLLRCERLCTLLQGLQQQAWRIN